MPTDFHVRASSIIIPAFSHHRLSITLATESKLKWLSARLTLDSFAVFQAFTSKTS